MKKCLIVLTIFLLFVFLAACNEKSPPVVVTVHPSAQPLLSTLAVIATTAESIGQTATAYAATLTPSNTPTKIPDANVLKNQINEAIKDEPVASFGATITLADVKFGPIGAKEFTHLYIEMNCKADNNAVCPTTQVMIAVMKAFKDKKKKMLENIPGTTQALIITISDPGHPTIVVETDWSDVRDYVNGDLPAEKLSQRIRYTPY